MADIKMSEFKEVDKVDKLLGLDDSGNGCCIRNDVLLDNLFQVRGTVSSDLDNYTSNGVYGINKDGSELKQELSVTQTVKNSNNTINITANGTGGSGELTYKFIM